MNMNKSWKKRKSQRRPPLLKKKSEATAGAAAVENSDLVVPAGIELTPISPQIIQSVKDLPVARGVDVESIAN